MCSVGDEELEDVKVASRGAKSKLLGRACMKCSSNLAVVLVRLNDPLCRACFMTYFIHKFRSTISKARVVRHDERVLLAVSGGPSSMAMLHLVSDGVSEKVARKLRFQPAVIFINEATVLGLSNEEQMHNIKEIRQVVEDKGLAFHCVSLEDLVQIQPVSSSQKDGIKEEHGLSSESLALKGLFESVKSLTAKEDLLKSLRLELLIQVAREKGYTKVMIGDCANRISVRLLSDISQGRGSSLPFGTAFADNRHGDIKFLRPMREFVAKEISLYNVFSSVEVIHIPSLTTKLAVYASIDRLTEEFISGLQAQFPFTVSTVFRTGDKLSVKEQTDEFLQCALCGVPVPPSETSIHKSLDQMSLNYSDKQGSVCKNTSLVDKDITRDNISSVNKGCCSSGSNCTSSEPSTSDVMAKLCYGCQLTLKDTKGNLMSLPFVADHLKRNMKREEMREEIQDFLLQDDNS